jgi:hypothetical protein
MEATKNARRFHVDGLIARTVRNRALRVAGRKAGDGALAQFDWLYQPQPSGGDALRLGAVGPGA